jgi:hypothetical protein
LSSAGVVLALGIGLSWLGPLALWLAHLVPALLALAWMARHFIRQPLPATRF